MGAGPGWVRKITVLNKYILESWKNAPFCKQLECVSHIRMSDDFLSRSCERCSVMVGTILLDGF